MNQTALSLEERLNEIMDAELAKQPEELDAEVVCTCARSLLLLEPGEKYTLTDSEKQQNICAILIDGGLHRIKTKRRLIVLIAAAILAILLALSAIAIGKVVIHRIDNSKNTDFIFEGNGGLIKIDTPVEADYIPDGYELVEVEEQKYLSSKVYFNDKENKYLHLDKDQISGLVSLDNEHGEIETIVVDGIEVTISGDEDFGGCALWYDEKYMYSIVAKLPKDEMIKVVLSLH